MLLRIEDEPFASLERFSDKISDEERENIISHRTMAYVSQIVELFRPDTVFEILRIPMTQPNLDWYLGFFEGEGMEEQIYERIAKWIQDDGRFSIFAPTIEE